MDDIIRQIYVTLSDLVATIDHHIESIDGTEAGQVIVMKKNGELYVVNDDDIRWLAQAFPGVNVSAEARKAATWNNDKPKRLRKTDVRKFLRNWCENAAAKVAKPQRTDIYDAAEEQWGNEGGHE